MGMFDYMHIAPSVIRDCGLKCPTCSHLASSTGWQTKDLDCVMALYSLDRDNTNTLRLFKVDPPEQQYWVEYTVEEIFEYNKTVQTPWLMRKPGDGYFTEEGWKIENRRKRSMGELPHQILNTYLVCEICRPSFKWPDAWIDVEIKFTDGIAVDIKQIFRRKEEE